MQKIYLVEVGKLLQSKNWEVDGYLALCHILQVLALPGLVWKQLTGEAVSWSKDFPAVDSVLVRTFKLLQQLHSHVTQIYEQAI